MSKLYRAVYDGGGGGYEGLRVRYALFPPHEGDDEVEIDRRGPVLVRYAGEAFFRVSCTGNVRGYRDCVVGAWAYPVFGPDGGAFYVDDGLRAPNDPEPWHPGGVPPRAIRTTKDAAAWLRVAAERGVDGHEPDPP